jgi:hypothetical protein
MDRIESDAIGPLIVLRVVGRPSALERDAASAALGRLFGAAGPRGITLDLRAAGMPGPRDARALAGLFVRHRAHLAERCVGVAVLVEGRAQRALVDALAAVARLPVPRATFSNAMAAEAWLRDHLAASR